MPSRAKARRAQAPRRRDRREVVTAVAGAVAIVGGTALLIWMIRPGNAVTPGSGGVLHRQPRASWLITIALVVEALLLAYLYRSRRFRDRFVLAGPISAVVVLVLAIVAGALWPRGLLRHYVSLKVPTNLTVPSIAPTTAPTATTTAGSATTVTTAPGATTAPAATNAPGATTAPATTAPIPTTVTPTT